MRLSRYYGHTHLPRGNVRSYFQNGTSDYVLEEAKSASSSLDQLRVRLPMEDLG